MQETRGDWSVYVSHQQKYREDQRQSPPQAGSSEDKEEERIASPVPGQPASSQKPSSPSPAVPILSNREVFRTDLTLNSPLKRTTEFLNGTPSHREFISASMKKRLADWKPKPPACP